MMPAMYMALNADLSAEPRGKDNESTDMFRLSSAVYAEKERDL